MIDMMSRLTGENSRTIKPIVVTKINKKKRKKEREREREREWNVLIFVNNDKYFQS